MYLLPLALVAASAVVAVPTKGNRPHPQSFVSSADRKYNLSSWEVPVRGRGDACGIATWKLDVDDTSSGYKQKISGFGASVTDSTTAVFEHLSSEDLDKLLKTLMTSEGANFNLFRNPVAGSDLSGDPAYTFDDNDDVPDPELKAFGLGPRGEATLELLKKMKDLQPEMRNIGSPWSPPGWMKNSRKLWGTTINNTLNHEYEEAYANYFVKYIQAFEEGGVHIDAITLNNEPLNTKEGNPSIIIQPEEAGNLIQQRVGPALKRNGLTTEIWAYDHNTDRPDYPQTVLDIASEYTNTVSWHCYADPIDWSVLTDFHNKNPHVTQVQAECWTASTTDWYQASSFTVGPLQNWGVGSIAWVLGTDTNYGPHLSYPNGPCPNCRGIVVVDVEKKTYELQVDYYMLAQYSKFIPRGSTVLAGTGSMSNADGSGIQSVATLNPDGTRTIVIENRFPEDKYVTTTLKSGKTWSGKVYGNSVVTWVVPAY